VACPPSVPPAFIDCPSLGARVPVAILYVDDDLYEICA